MSYQEEWAKFRLQRARFWERVMIIGCSVLALIFGSCFCVYFGTISLLFANLAHQFGLVRVGVPSMQAPIFSTLQPLTPIVIPTHAPAGSAVFPASLPTPLRIPAIKADPKTFGIYNLKVLLPYGWVIQETNLHADPSSTTSHECASYVLSDPGNQGLLTISPFCGTTDGQFSKCPPDLVAVSNRLGRYKVANSKMFVYTSIQSGVCANPSMVGLQTASGPVLGSASYQSFAATDPSSLNTADAVMLNLLPVP